MNRDHLVGLVLGALLGLFTGSVSRGVSIDLPRRLGMSADVLAVSGFSAAQADALMQRLLDAPTGSAHFASSETALDSTLGQIDSLNAEIDQTGDPTLVAQRDTLVAGLPAAGEAVRQASEGMVTVALDGIEAGITARAVQRGCVRLPMNLKALDLTPTVLDQVASAVATKQVEHREGNDLSGNFDPTAFLAPFRNCAEATSASASLASNRDAIRQVVGIWAGRE